jgi:sporulation integral membrane protein YtvI
MEVAVVFVFVFLIVLLFSFSMKYILPFVIGWVLALFLRPLVQRLENNGVARTPAVLIVLSSTLIICIVLFAAVITAIFREAFMLTSTSTFYFQRGNLWVTREIAKGKLYYGHLPPQVNKQFGSAIQETLSSVEQWLHEFVKFLLLSVTHLPENIFIAVIATITAFFVLKNREGMSTQFIQALPPGWGAKLHGVLKDMSRAFVGSLRVQIQLMGIAMILGVFGMWLLGFPYAVILGILLGLLGIVPVLGSALLTIPWALGALALGDISSAIKLIALQLVVSASRHMIEPKILANSVGLDTLSTLFSMYVGLQSIGFLGLFLGPIVLIGIKSLMRTHLFIDFLPGTLVQERNEQEQSKQTE